jgi:hypothetical protein
MQRNGLPMSYRDMTKTKLTLFLILWHFAASAFTTLGGQVIINQNSFNNFDITADLIIAPKNYNIDLDEIQIYTNLGDERIMLRGYDLISERLNYTNCERTDSFVSLEIKTNFSLDDRGNNFDAHCWLTVELVAGNRSPIITNIKNKETPFFIYSKINRCLKKANHSPMAQLSSFGLCVESPLYIDILPIDTSQSMDSTSYVFSYPMSAMNQYESYPEGYYLDQPLKVFYEAGNSYPFRKLDNNSGSIEGFNNNEYGKLVFIALPMDDLSLDKTALSLHYKKWRTMPNGQKEMVCEGIYEYFLNISFCAINLPPEMIFEDTDFYVNGGNKVEIKINTFDKPLVQEPPRITGKQDYVSLTWNRTIPGAKFETEKKDIYFDEGIFTWQTSSQDIREEPYIFKATAKDNNCFPTLTTQQDFYIYVVENISVNEKTENPFRLFPNPTSGLLQWTEKLTDIVIYDATGKEQKRLSSGTQIDVSDLAVGYYFFSGKRNGEIINGRFLTNID